MESVGKRIRSMRQLKGMTQKALGELSGINEANIRKYELGTQNPKDETLGKIAAAMGLDPLYFTDRYYQYGRWIPTKQELPQKNSMVLVQASGSCNGLVFIDALELAEYTSEGWIFEAFPEWNDAQVVAWMPLPKLYEE